MPVRNPHTDTLRIPVANRLGLWCLMRDCLRRNGFGLPRWFCLDFVDYRRSIGEVDPQAAYAKLAEAHPEIRREQRDALIELEKGLEAQLIIPAGGDDASPWAQVCLQNERLSFCQLYAGAVLAAAESSDRPAFKVGASLSGPLFFGYVHRVMQRALVDGVRRLYFLARDGQLLLEIAKVIQAEMGTDLELRYLHVSRKSMRLPSVLRLSERDLDWIFEEMDNRLTVATVAGRVAMEPRALRESAGVAELPSDDSAVLDAAAVKSLRAAFLDQARLREAVESKAAAARGSVLAYFGQEGLLDGTPSALVDVGWKGTLQDAIYRIVQMAPEPYGLTEYYLGCTAYSGDTGPQNRKVPFFLHPSRRPGLGPMVELLLLADHGMTLGFEADARGRLQPLTKPEGAHPATWGLKDYFEGVCAFSRHFARGLREWGDLFETHYEALVPFLMERVASPDSLTAETLGALPYSGNQEESNLREMAPPFSAVQALRYVLSGKETRGAMTQWPAATRVRSAAVARAILVADLPGLAAHVYRYFKSP